MKNRIQGKRFENDYTVEELEEIYSDISYSVTVPVNVAIKAEHRVLDLSRMEEILRDAEQIVLQDCGCRVDRESCDAPRDVCLNLDDAGEYELKSGRYNPRKVTLEEALEALRRSHEAGLVHMAYTLEGDDRPKVICSCCTCCCHTLSGLLRFGLAPHVLTSDLVSVTNLDICTNSGICADRCPFGAREIVDGRLVYHPQHCFGCGLCVSTCPTQAITLVRKNESNLNLI